MVYAAASSSFLPGEGGEKIQGGLAVARRVLRSAGPGAAEPGARAQERVQGAGFISVPGSPPRAEAFVEELPAVVAEEGAFGDVVPGDEAAAAGAGVGRVGFRADVHDDDGGGGRGGDEEEVGAEELPVRNHNRRRGRRSSGEGR